MYILPTIRGTKKTVEICDGLYGEAHHKNGTENAFRHALWNILIARYSLDAGRPLEKSLKWAETITYWHEDFSPNKPLARAMDLHNNTVGIELVAQFPKETEDFFVAHLLKMVPLSRKRTNVSQLSQDAGFLVHIE